MDLIKATQIRDVVHCSGTEERTGTEGYFMAKSNLTIILIKESDTASLCGMEYRRSLIRTY